MVGKHTGQGRRRGLVALASVVVALLAAGAVWIALYPLSGRDGSVASPSSTASTPDTRTASASTTTTTTTTATSSPASSPTDAALAKAQRALATCRDGVVQHERLAAAAAASAGDWRVHTDAQLKLDSGDWEPAQAEAVWAKSTSGGSAHLQQFAAAAAVVRTRGSAAACRSVVPDTASTPLAEKAKQCAARHQALTAVASTGGVVNGQWATHFAMMADKPHTNSAAYHDRWVRMVAEAQAPLKRYADAAAALSRAPACPGES